MRKTIESLMKIMRTRIGKKNEASILMSAITFMFLSTLMSTGARANDFPNPLPVVYNDTRGLTLDSGDYFRYYLHYNFNAANARDVHVFLVESHWIAGPSRLLVLRGRDTNADNLIDTWFYSDGAIIKWIRRPALSEDAWPVIKSILKEQMLNQSRWMAQIILSDLLKSSSFMIEGDMQIKKDLEVEQMDAIELGLRIEDAKARNENAEVIAELERVHKVGWDQMMEHWNKARLQERDKNALKDLGLTVGGGILLRGVARVLGKALAEEQKQLLKEAIRKIRTEKPSWIITNVNLRGAAGGAAGAVARSAIILGGKSKAFGVRILQNHRDAILWLNEKQFMSQSLIKAASTAKEILHESWKKKGYIAFVESLQFLVETYSRGFWSVSDAPLFLDHPVESTKNLLNAVRASSSLKQNMGYMTLQTTLLAGLDEVLLSRGKGKMFRWVASGIVTMIDSASYNLLLLGKNDPKRIGIDTGWDVATSFVQLTIDQKGLAWTSALANRIQKPGFKVVGYLIVAADQVAGFKGYNYLVNNYVEDNTKSPANVPVIPTLPAQRQYPNMNANKSGSSTPTLLGPAVAPPAAAQIQGGSDEARVRDLLEAKPIVLLPLLAPVK